MTYKPLSEILRPTSLDEILGQEHLTGQNGIIRKLLANQQIQSMILWGPPGTGKTSIARIIANQLNYPFYNINAVHAGVKEVREIMGIAQRKSPVVLFIDEIHRFNKAQQDALLAPIENGSIILIGATAENPSFELIRPLISRTFIFILKPLQEQHLAIILKNAIQYLSNEVKITVEQSDALFHLSAGDARKLIQILELIIHSSQISHKQIFITNQLVEQTVLKKIGTYDKKGDYHYDIISAYIKSIRGSDPNAALYWLARMLNNGEDPLFIARRLIILASEDIGNANPTALILANACFDSVHKIGMPEAQIILSQTTIYLACSPKSNSAYLAIKKAMKLSKETDHLPVPLHLRNAPTNLTKSLHYGENYLYPHNFKEHFTEQEYFPPELSGTIIYEPAQNNRERELKQFLLNLWKTKYHY